MPSLSYSSVVKAANETHSIVLTATHTLVLGSPSETTLKMKTQIPRLAEVLHSSDISLVLSAKLNKQHIPHYILQSSYMAVLLTQFLRINQTQLGVSNVSQAYIDDDGLPKITISPCSLPAVCYSLPSLSLISIQLSFSCESSSDTNSEDSPFDSQPYLPTLSLWGMAFTKFAASLTRSYPFIFSGWAEKLALEIPTIRATCHSILAIFNRSRNPAFVEACEHYFKKLRSRFMSNIKALSQILQKYIDSSHIDFDATSLNSQMHLEILSTEDLICASMVMLLKAHFKPKSFKVISASFVGHLGEDAALLSDEDATSSQPSIQTGCNTAELDVTRLLNEDHHSDDLDLYDDTPMHQISSAKPDANDDDGLVIFHVATTDSPSMDSFRHKSRSSSPIGVEQCLWDDDVSDAMNFVEVISGATTGMMDNSALQYLSYSYAHQDQRDDYDMKLLSLSSCSSPNGVLKTTETEDLDLFSEEDYFVPLDLT